MKINIIDYNKCNLENCNCGWNLTISGDSDSELALRKIKAFLVANFETEDKVKYEEKINSKKFINIDHVD